MVRTNLVDRASCLLLNSVQFPIENTRCQDFAGNVHKSGWYLALLAVDPAYHGKGLGSGLLRYGGARVSLSNPSNHWPLSNGPFQADKDGLPSVLECEEHNVSTVPRVTPPDRLTHPLACVLSVSFTKHSDTKSKGLFIRLV